MRWLIACLLFVTALAYGDWAPPANPDPSAILREAKVDARAERYGEALAKQLWFHRHALEHERGLYGVRLSFALQSWINLGKRYPPALKTLKEVRDEAGLRVRSGEGTWHDFHDFVAISESLAENVETANLFVWLDQNNPALAKRSYVVAQGALIHAKQYQLCGKYIDPAKSVELMLQVYGVHQRLSKKRGPDSGLMEFADKSLAHDAGTLVALLVLNERTSEADQVIAAVLKERPDPDLKSKLENARKGVIPEPWPKRGS
jgi:hypothetical protein